MPKKILYTDFINKCNNKFKDKISFININKDTFNYSNKKEYFKCNKHNKIIYVTPKNLILKHSCDCICSQCTKEYLSQIKLNNKNIKHHYKKRINNYSYTYIKDIIKSKNCIILNNKNKNLFINKDVLTIKCNECNNIYNLSIKQIIKNKYLCCQCRHQIINNKLIKRGCENRKNIFIKQAIKQHGNFYDYSKVKFNGKLSKVEIICPLHGSFFMMPSNHITRGQGCPLCNKKCLNNERRLGVILSGFINILNNKYNLNLNIISQYHNKLKRQSLDYFIYNNNIKIGIEYQGQQHFEMDYYNKYFKDERHSFEHLCELDKIKYEKCKKLNIKIFYFTFNKKYNNIKYLDTIYTDIDLLKNDILSYIKNNNIN